jgi:hypothetical protein
MLFNYYKGILKIEDGVPEIDRNYDNKRELRNLLRVLKFVKDPLVQKKLIFVNDK